jgi:hypothetical protein
MMSSPPPSPPVPPKPTQRAAVGIKSVEGMVNEHFASVGYIATPTLTVTILCLSMYQRSRHMWSS